MVGLCATASAAQEPLSAIDWLSNSTFEVLAPPDPPVLGVFTRPVETHPLDELGIDGVGLISAADAGLPPDLWGASQSAEIAALLASEPQELLPAARDLLKRILLAELNPPRDASSNSGFLVARVDRLLALGALNEAEILLENTGTATPDLFRRRFDVALLTGDEVAACRELDQQPNIFPTHSARIFCLARSGDWSAAALTLESANALGILDPDEDALLLRFLDPGLADELEPLTPPLRPSPLKFRLFEAIGEPLPTGTLPLAFAHADLRPQNGWKGRIEAAERLVRAGAIDANLLFGLYTRGRPSASGGVWERVGAIQSLEDALADEGNSLAQSAAIEVAWTQMALAGLEIAFVDLYANQIGEMDLEGPGREIARRMVLLNGSKGVRLTPGTNPRERFELALAENRPSSAPATDPLGRAVQLGLSLAPVVPSGLTSYTSTDRRGEALLRTIDALSGQGAGDLDDITNALLFLRYLSLEESAKSVALELILLRDSS